VLLVTANGDEQVLPLDQSDVDALKLKVVAIMETDAKNIMLFKDLGLDPNIYRDEKPGPRVYLKASSLSESGVSPGMCIYVVCLENLDADLTSLVEKAGNRRSASGDDGISSVLAVLTCCRAMAKCQPSTRLRLGGSEKLKRGASTRLQSSREVQAKLLRGCPMAVGYSTQKKGPETSRSSSSSSAV